MKTDIILAGVGGQGILSIAAIIGTAALKLGLNMKQSEVHGMSQRGGAVMSNMRLSNNKIYSDTIPKGDADIVIAVEPMESLRYIDHLKKDAWIISNTTPFVNVTDYPNKDLVIEEINKRTNVITIDADKIAKEIGAKKSSNIVMLGASSNFLNINIDALKEAIAIIFAKKSSEIINKNIEAFDKAREYSERFMKENK